MFLCTIAQPPFLQTLLAQRVPLCMATLLGTHNTAITLADGYGNLDLYFEQYLKWIKWAVRTVRSAGCILHQR